MIPALIILAKLFGLEGVLNSNPVSDSCSIIVVTCIYIHGSHELDKKALLSKVPSNKKSKVQNDIILEPVEAASNR